MWAKDWSPDNRYLMFHKALSGQTMVYLLPTTGDPKPRLLVATPGIADGFRFSPDSQWIAWASNDSGKFEVYVASLSAPANRRQVSIGGGAQPAWRNDGKELFYLTQEGKLMAVELKPGSPLQADAPKPLFQSNATGSYVGEVYAPSAGGRRFLFAEPENRDAGNINVVVNWDAGLRRGK